MGIAKECYNPNTFTPDDKPLFSLGQWQMLQLYLVDVMKLNLTSQSMPYADVRAIYIRLHAEAMSFHGNTLSQAQNMGNDLYNYGLNAAQTFNAVVQLMDESTPNKDAIVQLLGNLKATAAHHQAGTTEIYQGVKSYISATHQDISDLAAAAKREIDKIGADRTKIVILQNQYQAKYADKQAAQAQITSDKHALNSTKYYSWIPFVGTVVAVDKIVEKRKDIANQLARIGGDVQQMQSIQQQIQATKKEIGQLTYASQYNQHMATELGNAMGPMQLIEGAWKTISDELGDVMSNVQLAAASELKNEPCLAAVALTTAADEWQDVGNDGHVFNMNFRIQPNKAA